MKTLRIFISSPGDVRPERVRAYDVVQRLQTKFRAFLRLEPILWEHEAMRATATFQAQILPPSQADIVVCILWARIGMRLPRDYRRPDGTIPTGTEWEFEDAYTSHARRGIPDLLVYRKRALPTIRVESDQHLVEWQQQKKALDQFLDHWGRDHEGAFKAAFNSFTTDEEFEQKLTQHLEKIINLKLQEDAGANEEEKRSITWFEGSPFRGLNVFEPEHESIFFGRDLAIRNITDRLLAQASTGRVFLMVFGMSGCGKSSLVRAGVIPEILRPGTVAGIDCWRWAIFRPAESSDRLIDGFAEALFKSTGLPELESLGYDSIKLAGLLSEAPVHAIPLLQAALDQAAHTFAKKHQRADPPSARLLFVVDQLEEMFTLERFDSSQRKRCIDALAALSQSGLVWVITTMRSDLYGRCAEIEELLLLKGADGQFDLTPPSVSEIGQMIRAPARAAGLHFELHPTTHQPLDEALHEEAAQNPESLPLLEFALEELYKLRTDKNVITWQSYNNLGGLKGAIAKRAEEVFDSLSDTAHEALPAVLGALIALSENETATARRARRDEIAAHAGAEEVVSAYSRANLFVTDIDQFGRPTVALAHEALITSWPRVQTWLSENKDFLRSKARLGEAAARWTEARRDADYLLPEGKPLAEGEALLSAYRSELEPDLIQFVDLSSHHHRGRHQAKLRRARSLAVVFAVLLLMGLAAAWGFFRQSQRANRMRDETNRLAQINLSKSDEQGVKLFADDQPEKALAFLARSARMDSPWARERVFSLLTQRSWPLSSISSLHHSKPVLWAEFDATGRRVLTASQDGTACVWDALTGRLITTLRHDDSVVFARFSRDGQQIVTASADDTARIWNAENGAPLSDPLRHAGQVTMAQFSPDGLRVVTASTDGKAQLWDSNTGKALPASMQHAKAIRCVQYSPDGHWIATASEDNTARVWNAENGTPVSPPAQHEHTVRWVEFSPDSSRIVTASEDNSAKLWDAKSGKPIGQPMKHDNKVTSASFSPDGSRVVTASGDGTARQWSAESGSPVSQPLRHMSLVRRARYSPDGRWIVTASYDQTARVWDAATGASIAEAMTHDGGVECAQFSPDGRHIVTAGYDDVGRIWDISAGDAIGELIPQRGIRFAQFSPQGNNILTLTKDVAQVWSGSGRRIGAPLRHGTRLNSARFSGDGKRVITTSDDKTARIWDATTGNMLGQPLVHKSEVTNAVFSPDGSKVVTAAEDNCARLWVSSNAQSLGAPMKHDGFITSLEFSQDGRWIASASYDTFMRVWDGTTGMAVGRPSKHPASVDMAHFSPDGKRIVTAANDTTARIWDFQTGRLVVPLTGHTQIVTGAQFSPDGTQVVTASKDYTARVWDAKSGAAVAEPFRHKDVVCSAVFSPDGQSIITASLDRTARSWDVKTGVPLTEPLSHASAVVLGEFSPDGRHVLTASDDGTGRVWELGPKDTCPNWFTALAEAIGGWQLNEFGTLRRTKDRQMVLDQLRTQVGNSAVATDGWERVARWFFEDRSKRTLSYSSQTTITSYLADRIHENRGSSLEEALRIQPGNPIALARLASALIVRVPPESRQAEWLSKLAIEMNPHEPDVWVQRAIVLLSTHRLDQAFDAVNEAIKLNGNYAMALDCKANILLKKGQASEALQPVSKAIDVVRAQDPLREDELVKCLADRARVFSAVKKVELARTDIAEIQKIDSDWETPEDLKLLDSSGKSEITPSALAAKTPKKKHMLVYICFNDGAVNYVDPGWTWWTCWRCGALNYL